MPKTAPKVEKAFKSVDEELAFHLEKAEDHLIKAIMLFARSKKPERSTHYLERLGRVQEVVTSLLREELVLRRGLKRPR